jgi:demethylmenaquinone methyltransferase/2-methoxy-6-polyprenyl-1,4-benzoquinol methylase
VVILEFTLPENALLRGAYLFYCNIVLPRVGGWLARDASGAYRYLPKSIATFEPRRSMIARLAEAGFRDVGALSLHFGGVAVYHGHV